MQQLNLDTISNDATELQKIAATLRELASYAENRAWAIIHHEKGRTGAAQGIETKNRDIYQRLPEWAKW